MPLVVTEEGGSGRSKSRGSATSSSSGSFPNNLKVLRRSRTLDEDSSSALERQKQVQRHGSQSLDELVRCAICLDQLCRPTMVCFFSIIYNYDWHYWYNNRVNLSSYHVNIHSVWFVWTVSSRKNLMSSPAQPVGFRSKSRQAAYGICRPIFSCRLSSSL